MTGSIWKKLVLQAAETVSVNPYLTEEIDSPRADTLEAVSVLLETLPGTSPARIEKALREMDEMGDSPSREEFRKLALRRLEARTEEKLELLDAEILEAAMSFLNQVRLIDISPSYHYHD